MATFETPIGKVRYYGRFRYITAVPNPQVKTGTTVVKRSNSGYVVLQELHKCFSGVAVDTAAPEVRGDRPTVLAAKDGHGRFERFGLD